MTEANENPTTEGAERRLLHAPDASARSYRNVIRAISETPWAILPSVLEAIKELVAMRADGQLLSDDEIQARIGAGPAQRSAYTAGSVAVLPLYGVLMPRATLMSEISGGTSLERFSAALRELAASDNVGSIVIDVHSPGGSCYLVPETAAEVRAARSKKPVIAVADTLSASAAYHIASQADELIASPSALVGSIGVYTAHEDWSKFDANLGVKTTLISAGKYKTEGNPFEPLSEEARQAMQASVDELYALFVADVAKGRGVSVADVRNGFGEGRVLTAKAALAAGMVDRIEPMQATLARLAKGGSPAKGARAEAGDGEEPISVALVFDAPADPPEPEAAPPTLVDGAERLLARPGFREQFLTD
jgi:capsid assembly protease